ncbi:protein-tyrosine-phosphatase IBR5-like [Olea europaea var. sylvestris]|uniref:-tyrosine-phosphatase IBR5-like n=1 Tax=Olea europaea subsp. europaea TaxID=158383 RepID=A0A8S0RPA5_OLEEU|nr:protein-tyrosine-phosphatase IBR5-like [Olea europaea var. sylvestris]CAA2981095.1 -tyrosine-phosphatase IBR5-like [Olea europaea subsp. europaea]
MRKRERENPCGVCGHYHKYEEGEVCGICGHRMPAVSDNSAASSNHVSAFPSEILPEFLFLGSYDNASRAELLKTQGISRVLNTVPACQNLYKNSFTYHCLQDDPKLPFDDAIKFLEQCEKDGARVLVHCMSGKSRSPAIVMAYLMKNKGWKLAQSYQWVKDRRPSVELTQAVFQQLKDYEQKIFGSTENSVSMPSFSLSSLPSFSFGFPKPNDPPVLVPVFNNSGSTSIFSHQPRDIPQEFSFGAVHAQENTSDDITTFNASTNISDDNDIPMDGS